MEIKTAKASARNSQCKNLFIWIYEQDMGEKPPYYFVLSKTKTLVEKQKQFDENL